MRKCGLKITANDLPVPKFEIVLVWVDDLANDLLLFPARVFRFRILYSNAHRAQTFERRAREKSHPMRTEPWELV